MSRSDMLLAGIRFILCFVLVVVFGLVAFGDRVFDHSLTYFQFIPFGLMVAAFAALLPVLKPWSLLLLGVLAYAGVALQAGSGTSALLLRDAVGVTSLILATGLSLRVMRFFPSVPVGRFIFWAAIFAVTHTAALYLLATIHSVTPNSAIPPAVVRIGALIGGGAGLGFELATVIGGRLGYGEKS